MAPGHAARTQTGRRRRRFASVAACALLFGAAFSAHADASDADAEALARQRVGAAIEAAGPWTAALAAATGPSAELRWRLGHARLAGAADGAGAAGTWRRIVALARAQGRHAARRQAQAALSNLGYRRGDFALTRAVELESLADARRLRDRHGEADALQDLGLVATVTGDPDGAERHFREAIEIWRTVDAPMGLARALRGLARVHEMKGHYPQALQQHVGALELMQRHGTAIEQSESHYSLARLFLNLEDAEAGLRAADRAIALMGRTPPDFPLGLNLAVRSQLHRAAGRVGDAVADGEAAVAAFERAGSATGLAIAQLALGQARVLDGAADEGLALLDAGLATARAADDRALAGDLLLAQGAMRVRLGRHDDAIAPLGEAMAIGEALGLDRLRQDVSLQMETLHAARGRPEEALAWSRRAFEYRGRLSSLGDLAALGAEATGEAAAARARFMALGDGATATAAVAGAGGAAPFAQGLLARGDDATLSRAWWLLALPSLLLLWGLVRGLRTQAHLRAEKESISRRQRELESANHDLQSQSERLRRQVAVDPLTGAMTRAAFAAELDAALRHACTHDRPLALLVFDLDHFKAVNDELGHLAGDAALQLVTGVAREKLRSQDLLGRFGGDEFLIAVPGMDGAGAEALAESIRFEVVWRAPDHDPPMPELSISVGCAVADPGRGYDAESLFRRADGALFRAKRGGRNRVLADDPAAAGSIVADDRPARRWTLPLAD